MKKFARQLIAFALLGGGLFLPAGVWAQQSDLAGQSLREYGHVFIAYAVAWVLVLGWLVSVFRRMGRLDRELKGD